jgi:hypothetical protein
MDQAIKQIVIVGGGTAGWLTAAIIAAEHLVDEGRLAPNPLLRIVLVESPQVPTIGVGEGTWPSMRQTLQKIGISETEFFRCCDASFKQGSQFVDWQQVPSNGRSSYYLHPFTLPVGAPDFNICPYWLAHRQSVSFADAVSQQAELSVAGFAPKFITTPEYSFVNNYGYHLDAGKFSQLLQKHCLEKLGVQHIADHVSGIESASDGDIAAIVTVHHGRIAADLFIDCSGQQSLLLGQHLQVPFLPQQQVLFNDRALAVQVPYADAEAPIAANTLATAQAAGWIWDIGLPTRRGVGHCYSSAHCSDEMAFSRLYQYVVTTAGHTVADALSPKQLVIKPGYHEKCLVRNCMAIGMAAGFIEPLEASALALVEWSAKQIASQLPRTREGLDLVAARINQSYLQHWQQIISFLKLHYVLSQRDDDVYWRDHRDTVPDTLQAQLRLWQEQVPSAVDFRYQDQLFPAASYQYVLYGMHFTTADYPQLKPSLKRKAQELFQQNAQRVSTLRSGLPTVRDLLNKIAQYGLPPI